MVMQMLKVMDLCIFRIRRSNRRHTNREKAFDKVGLPHKRSISKLYSYKIHVDVIM